MATKVMKDSGMGMICHHGMCTKCHAGTLLILGVLVLLNTLWSIVSWGVFVGAILILGGLLKLVKPACPHCK